MNEVQAGTGKLVMPVMHEAERDAAVVVLRAMLGRGELVARDEDMVRGAVEAMLTAPRFEAKSLDENRLGAFQRRSATSREAALRNYPRSGSQRLDVLHRIAREGNSGATRDELVQWLGRSPQSVTPRVKELVQGLWLEVKLDADGRAVTRRTRAGSEAEVLVLSQRARAELRRRGARVTA